MHVKKLSERGGLIVRLAMRIIDTDNLYNTSILYDVISSVLWFILALQITKSVSILMYASSFKPEIIIMIVAQVALATILLRFIGKRDSFIHNSDKLILKYLPLLISILLFITMIFHGAYLSFHTSKYQISRNDNALIVAYDEHGRAIEKVFYVRPCVSVGLI